MEKTRWSRSIPVASTSRQSDRRTAERNVDLLGSLVDFLHVQLHLLVPEQRQTGGGKYQRNDRRRSAARLRRSAWFDRGDSLHVLYSIGFEFILSRLFSQLCRFFHLAIRPDENETSNKYSDQYADVIRFQTGFSEEIRSGLHAALRRMDYLCHLFCLIFFGERVLSFIYMKRIEMEQCLSKNSTEIFPKAVERNLQ